MSFCSNMVKMAKTNRLHTHIHTCMSRTDCAACTVMTRQGQLWDAVELPSKCGCVCTQMGRYRQGRLDVPAVLFNVGRYKWCLLSVFCSDPHGNLQCRGTGCTPLPPPNNLPERMHKGPLIGHPLPLQRKRMCQRHPLAAWPPGRRRIWSPKRPSSHCGAGPRLHGGGAGAKTPLASLGGPCETSTLATLVRRPQIL